MHTATNGPRNIDARVDAVEEQLAAAQETIGVLSHGYGKLVVLDEHLERNTKQLDRLEGNVERIAKALGVIQDRGSRAEEFLTDAARRALSMRPRPPSAFWKHFTPRNIIAIITALTALAGAVFAGKQLATPPPVIVAPAPSSHPPQEVPR